MKNRQLARSKTAFLISFGNSIQIVALIVLVGLIPYTLFVSYELYRAAESHVSAGAVVYCLARFAACLLLIYALWRLRQAALRLRNTHARGR